MDKPPAGNTAWSSGSAYEAYVGRWSALVAPELIARLAVARGRRWLDVGSGTGVLTRAILASAAPSAVIGVDPSEPFVEHARATVIDPRVSFRPGTATETGLGAGEVDVVAFGFVLNYVPDVSAALEEARRVVAPGGVVVACVWDYADGMEFIRAFWEVAVGLDPAAASLDQRRFPIATPDGLREAFVDAGLESVQVDSIEIPTTFRDFDDFWTPFTLGTGQAPAYLARLETTKQDGLRESLRAALPIEPDGQIRLSARAWTCQARAPGP